MSLHRDPATLTTFAPHAPIWDNHTFVRVEGKMSNGDLFGFDMIHFTNESEFTLIARAQDAFEAYNIDVEDYVINV